MEEYREREYGDSGMIVRAILLAAGKGTRMKSARPKVLHELCGRSMLWYALAALRDAGIEEIVVVTNPELDPQVRALGVRTVVQGEQLGTGHAVQVALAALEARADGRIVVTNGDMPLVRAETLVRVLSAAGENDVALVTARMPLPSNFGRIVRHGERVARIVEVRDASESERAIDEMNAGIYAFPETHLRDAVARLRSDNAQGEYYLTDAIELSAAADRPAVPVVADEFEEVLGVNDRSELARARAAMNRRICERHMLAGVTIVDPATTFLEPELTIGIDTVIYPGTAISLQSSIGSRCTIGPHTRISDARIGDDVTVQESVVIESEIGSGSAIGPFAHVRGHAVLVGENRVGNFVEIKNSRYERGAKSAHLSYLGDAEIGEESNIGAGTITCNYDGKKKHRTKIGRNVSIGSNTSIVAPRTIGDGALTGAGSVVTKDIEPGGRVAGNPARPLP
ncbi:MAG: bifunctional UDP-N-acetylglucosamine diphosphorylase/glucosamine-1-phosphate N-acetyltransferase GlmU [Candidatus Eremiobacteraeota bacterium]|nr:bifunctional UDP-N-acetylglucosamine diphosphorylase/glucosamine-1-phosphate N-acetyltransferase GlmU [Candidatus Eremiobacteraeota bacterium]